MQTGPAEEGTPVEDAGETVPQDGTKDHNESCTEQARDSPKKTDLTDVNRKNQSVNGFAANIAMEALAKASAFISKNERIHKEYSGVGLNDPEDNQNSWERPDVNGNTVSPGGVKIGPSRNVLQGAHFIMPGTDKELQEKLKNRRSTM
ncbi:hypothetical protein C922_03394 [Plasmodium inui San Antonio 1]|uniref:Uncharacterized protein n=1 Tax=Plasmodium inui San Antonio 1 TaxID=1237626 RepID=W7AAU8_9APIC|nr:hypothetical protein C922_03394 [Plasmodium inui San Antonio 1]EUD66199.1 hypothetical protein C922_03394 [Plasmodium inui San Antonio 1]